jgi:hypothetical protein
MAQTKHSHISHASHSKQPKNKVVSKPVETDDEIKEPLDTKKAIDIEAALEPAAIVDEKVEDDLPIAPTEDGEEAAEELSLDDDELNPFGDKWEQ